MEFFAVRQLKEDLRMIELAGKKMMILVVKRWLVGRSRKD